MQSLVKELKGMSCYPCIVTDLYKINTNLFGVIWSVAPESAIVKHWLVPSRMEAAIMCAIFFGRFLNSLSAMNGHDPPLKN